MIDEGDKSDRWGWLFINYRGYGLSGGEPSGARRAEGREPDLRLCRGASLTWTPRTSCCLAGAWARTSRLPWRRSRPVRGVILATPFDSFAALGVERYPWLPVGLLLNGRYDAAGIAPTIKVPALFILAERDDVTPVEHGAALARAWGGPKRTVILEGARHYGIERRAEFWNAVGQFLRQIDSSPPRQQVLRGGSRIAAIATSAPGKRNREIPYQA